MAAVAAAAATTPEAFRGLVERLSRPGAACTDGDLQVILRLCVAVQAQLRSRTGGILATHRERPLLQCYMSDGWGARVSGFSTRAADGHLLRQEGRYRHEFLLERGLLRAMQPSGQTELAMLLQAPRSLTAGKGAWHMFAAGCQFQSTLRASQHEGIAMTVYLMDGCLFSSTWRKWRALHDLWYSDHGGADPDLAWLLQQSEWVFGIKCMLHGGHNSVHWGLLHWCAKEVSDAAHIATASLNNTSSAIHARMDLFMIQFLIFEDAVDATRDDVKVYWKTLDIRESMLDLFVQVDPRWDEARQRLLVSAHVEQDPECWEKCSLVIGVCRRWLNWTDTRWASIGRAGRFFTRSLATGLDSAVQQCFDDESCSNYNLSGYRRATPEVRLMLAIAAVASVPSEFFVVEMLADDRLLKRSQELHDGVVERMVSIAELPGLVWSRIAATSGTATEEFKHDVLLAMCVSYGYLVRDVFRAVWADPLRMAQGDIEANVAALGARDLPINDDMVARMRSLLDAGTPQQYVVDGLRLLQDSPCSIALVEEGHASGAVIMKDHERLSEKALRARALLHMMRPLVREKKIDQKAKRVVTSLQQLEKMNPNKAHARHMYLRHSVKEAMEAGPGDAASRLRDSRQCMSSHSQAFEALAAPERRQFEEARATHVASRWDNIKAAQAALVVKLRRLHQKEAEAVKSNGVPNHIAQARLNDRELESACEFFDSPGCQKLRLEAGPLGAFGLAPSAPSQAEQGVLRAVEDGLPQVDEAEPPWWCRSICRIRDCFWETAIGLEEEGEFWLVLFAKKNPHECTFLQLRPKMTEVDLSDGIALQREAPHQDRRQYEFLPPTICTEQDIPFPKDEDFDIFVRWDFRLHGKTAAAPHAPMAFERFLSMHAGPKPHNARAPGQRLRAVPAAAREGLLEEFPWLSEDDLPGGCHPARKRARADERPRPAADAAGSESDEPGLLEEAQGEDAAPEEPAEEAPVADDAEGAVDELNAVRDECAWHEEDPLYFYTRVLAGRWTWSTREKGHAADGCCGFARGGGPQAWCIAYEFPRQASFMFEKYGRDAACQLAREFCRRGEYYYQLYLEAGDEDFEYTGEHVAGYEESLQWLDFISVLDVEDNAFMKGLELRDLMPRLAC